MLRRFRGFARLCEIAACSKARPRSTVLRWFWETAMQQAEARHKASPSWTSATRNLWRRPARCACVCVCLGGSSACSIGDGRGAHVICRRVGRLLGACMPQSARTPPSSSFRRRAAEASARTSERAQPCRQRAIRWRSDPRGQSASHPSIARPPVSNPGHQPPWYPILPCDWGRRGAWACHCRRTVPSRRAWTQSILCGWAGKCRSTHPWPARSPVQRKNLARESTARARSCMISDLFCLECGEGVERLGDSTSWPRRTRNRDVSRKSDSLEVCSGGDSS